MASTWRDSSQQAQQIQQQLESAQERSPRRGSTAGRGGDVTVTVNGIGELEAVTIKAGSFDGSSDEDLSDLGDLIVAAYRDAKAQADALATNAIGPLAGGGMPGLAARATPGPTHSASRRKTECTKASSRT